MRQPEERAEESVGSSALLGTGALEELAKAGRFLWSGCPSVRSGVGAVLGVMSPKYTRLSALEQARTHTACDGALKNEMLGTYPYNCLRTPS